MRLDNKNFKRGFTLIEIMIAITLFTAIMILGTGAVLQTNAVHKKTQTMRSVMDNLNFIMEDMARNLRLGSSFQCPTIVPAAIPLTASDCSSGNLSIAFESVDGNPFIYSISPNSSPAVIYKSKDGINFIPITPTEVVIDPQKSGFTVVGADNSIQFGPETQPRVIIRLVGTVKYKDLESNFNLETTVSQRLLDI